MLLDDMSAPTAHAKARRKEPAKKRSGKSPRPVPPPLTSDDVRRGAELAARVGKRQGPLTVESVPLMQAAALAFGQRGARVAFVPTMGALHQGHVKLVEEAKRCADVVVVSIFVNPTQFGPGEDFLRYPRDPRGDLMKLQSAGADVAFFPSAHEMYPDGFQTTVSLGSITRAACGRFRPGHFAGVATVVLKLFQLVQPRVAVFGEKDWQQLQVIRRMVRDLHLTVEVVGVATLREPDGLAMSSRNLKLSVRDREQAPVLFRALTAGHQANQAGELDAGAICRSVLAPLQAARGVKLQYVELLDAAGLQPLPRVDRPGRILLAAHVGGVRLIDNAPVGPRAAH
jgi:pantoate--beta-alanine ligase